jgi:hypothetical protein
VLSLQSAGINGSELDTPKADRFNANAALLNCIQN